ncbi:MAG TPA: cytochrome C [Burkholderiales bacterium]|jgi:mono/diheme cytochrome c family protein|nr:cytochrome C [Burkholderiales bacterium]
MKFRTFAFAVLVAATINARAQEPLPGQNLHDTYCIGCHDSRVYTREDRLARDYREIRAQVGRWQQNIGLKWDDADIERVSSYIASKFYRLACPQAC